MTQKNSVYDLIELSEKDGKQHVDLHICGVCAPGKNHDLRSMVWDVLYHEITWELYKANISLMEQVKGAVPYELSLSYLGMPKCYDTVCDLLQYGIQKRIRENDGGGSNA